MAQNAALRIMERKSLRNGATDEQTNRFLINLMKEHLAINSN